MYVTEPPLGVVPDLVGMPVWYAWQACRDAGLVAAFHDPDAVTPASSTLVSAQEPAQGVRLDKGASVRYWTEETSPTAVPASR